METNEELKIGIGNEEVVALKPSVVKIVGVEVVEVGVKKSKKLNCLILHPDSKEPKSISSVKYENKGKLEVAGLWINKDSKGLIRKNSALATLLNFTGCNTAEQLIGKEVQTILDDKNYLAFKGY